MSLENRLLKTNILMGKIMSLSLNHDISTPEATVKTIILNEILGPNTVLYLINLYKDEDFDVLALLEDLVSIQDPLAFIEQILSIFDHVQNDIASTPSDAIKQASTLYRRNNDLHLFALNLLRNLSKNRFLFAEDPNLIDENYYYSLKDKYGLLEEC